MAACCVEDCSLTVNDDVILFEFPTSRLLRKRWLDAINPRSKLAEDARICSKHFTRRDYEEFRGKTRLKGKVVPTKFGKQVDSQEESSQESETESNKDEKTSKNNHKNKSHNDLDKSHNDNDKSHNDFDKPHNDNDKLHNDLDKSHNDNDKSHKDNDKSHNDNDKSHNDLDKSQNKYDNLHSSDNSDKSDSDTDYDIRPKKRKRGRPKKTKNIKSKTRKKVTPKRTRSDNKISDSNDLDSCNIDKKTETTKDNHNDKSHNDTDKSDSEIDNNLKENSKKSMENGRTSDNSFNSRNQRDRSPAMPADIEDIISKYQIENKKTERQLAAMAQELLMQAAEPVFIEMQVSQGPLEPESNDCLMLLESVQVEVDPTLMLEARAEDEECMEQIDLDLDSADEKERPSNKKPDQEISLLTSSDEDDVIIQEPKIDTVEVSDETDEDDVPLVKLVKVEKKTKQTKKKKKKSGINQILWKGSQDFYCFQCRHVSENRTEHKKHLQTHSKVIQICQDCGFTTCSKSQLYRHRRKHKNDKKHKCPLCNYSARHNMSLIYHLKTHRTSEKEVYMCDKCEYVSPNKSAVNRHKGECKGGVTCGKGDFSGEGRLHDNSRRKGSDDGSNSVQSLDDDATDAEDDD